MDLNYPSDLVTVKSVEYAKGWQPELTSVEATDTIPGVLERTARYEKDLETPETFVVVTFTPKKTGTAIFGFENNPTPSEISKQTPVESSLTVLNREQHLFASALSVVAENNVAATVVMWVVFALFYGLSFALR
jgi:hypothetical protein